MLKLRDVIILLKRSRALASIPDQVILDFMHLTCLGTVKKLYDLWLFQYKNTDIERNDFYFEPRAKETINTTHKISIRDKKKPKILF